MTSSNAKPSAAFISCNIRGALREAFRGDRIKAGRKPPHDDRIDTVDDRGKCDPRLIVREIPIHRLPIYSAQKNPEELREL
jgi:hypothetical protein